MTIIQTEITKYQNRLLCIGSILFVLLLALYAAVFLLRWEGIQNILLGIGVGYLASMVNLVSLGASIKMVIMKPGSSMTRIILPLVSFLGLCGLSACMVLYFRPLVLGFALGLSAPMILGLCLAVVGKLAEGSC